jgi:hypothetical protein
VGGGVGVGGDVFFSLSRAGGPHILSPLGEYKDWATDH